MAPLEDDVLLLHDVDMFAGEVVFIPVVAELADGKESTVM